VSTDYGRDSADVNFRLSIAGLQTVCYHAFYKGKHTPLYPATLQASAKFSDINRTLIGYNEKYSADFQPYLWFTHISKGR
jgi:hypothetical protein